MGITRTCRSPTPAQYPVGLRRAAGHPHSPSPARASAPSTAVIRPFRGPMPPCLRAALQLVTQGSRALSRARRASPRPAAGDAAEHPRLPWSLRRSGNRSRSETPGSNRLLRIGAMPPPCLSPRVTKIFLLTETLRKANGTILSLGAWLRRCWQEFFPNPEANESERLEPFLTRSDLGRAPSATPADVAFGSDGWPACDATLLVVMK